MDTYCRRRLVGLKAAAQLSVDCAAATFLQRIYRGRLARRAFSDLLFLHCCQAEAFCCQTDAFAIPEFSRVDLDQTRFDVAQRAPMPTSTPR